MASSFPVAFFRQFFHFTKKCSVRLAISIVAISAPCIASALAVDLEVDASAPQSVSTGQVFQYTIGLQNNGPGNLFGAATVVLTLPPGMRYLHAPMPFVSDSGWACSESAGGATCQFADLPKLGHALARVRVLAPVVPGTIQATAHVTGSPSDPDSANDTITLSTQVTASGSTADLEITQQTSANPVAYGVPYTHTLQVGNVGGAPHTGQIDVVDQLPAGAQFVGVDAIDWSCSQVEAWIRCLYFAALPADSAAPPIVVHATASNTFAIGTDRASVGGASDIDTSNNLAQEVTQFGIAPGIDVSLTQTDDADPVKIGGAYHYLLQARNIGATDESGLVTVVSTLPAGALFVQAHSNGWDCVHNLGELRCTHLGLASMDKSTIEAYLLAATVPGTAINAAAVSSPGDTEANNNTSTETTQIIVDPNAPDLALTMTAPPVVAPGSTYSYTLDVANRGIHAHVGSLRIVDVLPTALTLIQASGDGWNCSVEDPTSECVWNGTLAGGASPAPLTLTVAAPNLAEIVTNTAVVAGSADIDIRNNRASAETRVAQNTGPVMEPQNFTAPESMPVGGVIGTVVSTDDGLPLPALLHYTIVDSQQFSIDPTTGVVRLTMPLDFESTSSLNFEVAVSDGEFTINVPMHIDVTDAAGGPGIENQPPVVKAQAFSIPETQAVGTPVATLVATDDGLPANGFLAYAITGSNGPDAFAIDALTGVISVSKPLDFETFANYVLTVSVSDGQLSSTAEVTIVVLDIKGGPGLENDAPIAVGDAIQAAPSSFTSVLTGGASNLLWNDSDPNPGETATLVVSKKSEPSKGSLFLNPSGTFLYAAGASEGNDSFDYTVCDTHLACATATVRIEIGAGPKNRLPIAVDDAIQVSPGTTATTFIGGADNVLSNDFDLDGDALSAHQLSEPASGLAQFDSQGRVSYTPNPDATSDQFSYEACDVHGACAKGIVSITVSAGPMNRLPVATNDVAQSIAPHGDTGVLIDGEQSVLANDDDADAGERDSLKVFRLSAPEAGLATLNPDGSFHYANTAPEFGHDSFWYEACDIHGACAAAKVSIEVDTQAAELACTLTTQVFEAGTPVTLQLAKLFAAPAGQTLMYSVQGLPPSLVVDPLSGLLSGIPAPAEASFTPYAGILRATTVPGDAQSSENVLFHILPPGEIVMRNGFDLPPQPCQ